MNNYLTEDKLQELLLLLYPDHEFVRNKVVPNSEIKNRPDYRNEELKLIIEFDGDGHYCVPNEICKDKLKDEVYINIGYKVIRIPYFVQPSKIVIMNLFGIAYDIKQIFPHGFISDRAILPAAYCELGINRFLDDLKRFHYIREDIINSIKEKIKILDNHDLVIPKSIAYLLN